MSDQARKRTLFALAAAVLAAGVVVLVLVLTGDSSDDEKAAAASAPSELRSRPDLQPPEVTVDVTSPGRRDELIFVSPRREDPKSPQQQGALALDDRGRTVWFKRAPEGGPITDVRAQRYRGEPVITWWQGAATKTGIGTGEGVIVDRSYRKVATVRAGNGERMDLHEFLLTPRGTALLVIYSRTRRDLTAIGGLKDAQVTQGIVQEIDVETGEVLFEWRSIDDVDPSESHEEVPTKPEESYDYFHINSVDETEEGDFLVSARHTNTVYLVDRETAKVRWRLGGEKSTFEMGPGTVFGIQHDARELSDGTIQIFDNASEAEGNADQKASSVKRIRLDLRRKRATLVQKMRQPDGMWAQSQGNAQALPGGGVMAGWGSTGAFSLLDGRGRVLFDAHLPADYDTYRAFLKEWTGRPPTRPAIAVRRREQQVTVAASWNGATEVRAWQVLAGSAASDLKPVGRPAPWSGLETTTVRQTVEPYIAVAALDGEGRTLKTSRAVRRPMEKPAQ